MEALREALYVILVNSLIYAFYLCINLTSKFQAIYLRSQVNALQGIDDTTSENYGDFATDAIVRINLMVSIFGAIISSVIILSKTDETLKFIPFVVLPLVLGSYLVAIKLPSIHAGHLAIDEKGKWAVPVEEDEKKADPRDWIPKLSNGIIIVLWLLMIIAEGYSGHDNFQQKQVEQQPQQEQIQHPKPEENED